MYIEEDDVKKWPSLCEVTMGTLVTFVNLSLFDVSNSCSLYFFWPINSCSLYCYHITFGIKLVNRIMLIATILLAAVI